MLDQDMLAVPPGGADGAQGEPPLAAAAELARRLVHGRRASLMLPHSGTKGELRVVAAVGLPIPLSSAAPRRLGEPVAGQVAQSRQPMLIAGRAAPARPCNRYETGAFISIPITLEGEACGVLSVADPLASGTFGPSDLAILQTFAVYLSAFLARVQVQERTRLLEEEVRGLRRRVIASQEAERQRIAQEVHDELGHALIEAIFGLDQAASAPQSGDTPAGIVRAARQRLVDCATILHEVVSALRPRLLEERGLIAALRTLLGQTGRASGLRVELRATIAATGLGAEAELALFRVAQEAVTNILRHAGATAVRVELERRGGGVAMVVEDDGGGIDERVLRRRRGGGHGLAGMRERIAVLGGRLEVGRAFGGGTRVVAWVPQGPGAGDGP